MPIPSPILRASAPSFSSLPPRPRGSNFWRLALAAASLAPAAASPQTAEPAPEPATDENIVTLSPFEVTSSSDVGYLAGNTLAGSRLNTDIKDTPASIDVFTAELLTDLGASTLGDALAYANNLEVDQGDTDRIINGDSTVGPRSAYQFRSRGFLGTKARNYFESDLSIDFYNTERLDESRGPNSILFGIGSPGGLINTTTKRAKLYRDSLATEIKLGNEDLFRATLDANQVLIPRKLAIRVDAMFDDSGSWRDFLYTTKKAADLAATWQPSASTVIRAEYEAASLEGTITQNFSMRDLISTWWDAGSTTTNTTGNAAPTAAQQALGFSRLSATNRFTYVDNQAILYNARNEWSTRGDVYGVNSTSVALIRDDALVPYRSNPAGPGGRTNHDSHVWQFDLEHNFSSAISSQVSFYHEDAEWTNYDIKTGTTGLRGDPNEYFRAIAVGAGQLYSLDGYTYTTTASGVVNPNAGQPYIEANWRRRFSSLTSDTLRASLAGDWDLGLLGHHRLAALVQRQWKNNTEGDQIEAILGAPYASSPIAAANLLIRRHYATYGDSTSFAVPDWSVRPSLSYTEGGVTRTTGFINQPDTLQDSDRTIDSYMIAAQSDFWKKRIVTTAGYRIDTVKQDRVEETVDQTGIWAGTDGLAVLDPNNVSHFSADGHTTTLGVMLHLAPWASLFANSSENIGLPEFTYRLGPDGDVPPPPRGSGHEYGVQLNLLNGKIFGRITWFDTKQVDSAAQMGVNNAFTPSYNGIIGGLDGLYTASMMAAYSELRPVVYADADTIDNQAKGLETRFVLNLTSSFRLLANYSYTDQSKVNPYPRTNLLYAQLDQFVADVQAANPGIDVYALPTTNPSPPTGITTLGDELAYRLDDIQGRTLDFIQASGARKHKANITGSYSFHDGWLKGWTCGGGLRYQSGAIVGYDTVTGAEYTGNSSFLVDAMLRYSTRVKFGRGSRPFSLQLNIRNLLDDQSLIVTRTTDIPTEVIRWNFQQPRQILLTATLKL